MKKVKKQRFLALIISVVMIFSMMSAAVLAEETISADKAEPVILESADSRINVIDNVVGTNESETYLVFVVENSNVVVEENIESRFSVKNSELLVEGNITGSELNGGVVSNITSRFIDSEATVAGDVAIDSIEVWKSDVTIEGSLSSNEIRVSDGTLNVEGNMGSFTEGYSALIILDNGAEVNIGTEENTGNVSGGMSVGSESNVTVHGNTDSVFMGGGNLSVTGDITGGITVDAYYSEGTVICEGTVSSSEDAAVSVMLGPTSFGKEFNEYGKDYSPIDIIVYKLESESGELISIPVNEYLLEAVEEKLGAEETAQKLEGYLEATCAAVQYIVKSDSSAVSVKGTSTSTAGDYTVAHEGEVLTVEAPEGKLLEEVTAGVYATVTRNDDGTYSVVVNRGGDLTIAAILKDLPIETPKEPESNQEETTVIVIITETPAAPAVVNELPKEDTYVIGFISAATVSNTSETKQENTSETAEQEAETVPVTCKTLRVTKDMLRVSCEYNGTLSIEEYIKSIVGEELFKCIKNIKWMANSDSMQFYGNYDPHVIIEFDLSLITIGPDGVITVK